MECWNIGMLAPVKQKKVSLGKNVGVRVERPHFNCKKLLQTHYSITP